MTGNSFRLILEGVMFAGVFVGLTALVTLCWRNRLSRNLGAISLACIFVPALIMTVFASGYLPWQLALVFGVFAIPGTLAMIFQRTPRVLPPGHCTTCGYNLTGNVSGKCPECGAPVPAP